MEWWKKLKSKKIEFLSTEYFFSTFFRCLLRIYTFKKYRCHTQAIFPVFDPLLAHRDNVQRWWIILNFLRKKITIFSWDGPRTFSKASSRFSKTAIFCRSSNFEESGFIINSYITSLDSALEADFEDWFWAPLDLDLSCSIWVSSFFLVFPEGSVKSLTGSDPWKLNLKI